MLEELRTEEAQLEERIARLRELNSLNEGHEEVGELAEAREVFGWL